MAPPLKALLREALEQGVSFAARGNLILLAPPLVIEEKELTDALDLLDRLIAAMPCAQAGAVEQEPA
jgi:taurine--2-oxoglutarate transaminase